MDTNHGGRWKYNDPDVVMLGDDNEESESEDSEDSETSFESSENSEDKSSDTQSGEDLV